MLVIAPSGVHEQWLTEQYPEHCSVPYKSFTYKSKNTLRFVRAMDYFLWNARESKELHVFAMNIEAFARPKGLELAEQFLKTDHLGCAIIVDEASIIKTPDIVTVRNVKKLRDKYIDALRIVLTGTPAAKGPVNMWSIFDFLKRNYMGCSYVAFRMMHTIVYRKKLRVRGRLITVAEDMTKDLFAKVKNAIALQGELDDYKIEDIKTKYGLSTNNFHYINNSKEYQRFKNLDKLQKRIEPNTYAIKKSDCLNLPPKIFKPQYFKLNPHQSELIRSLQKYAVATYQGEELTLEVKALLKMRVLQICGGFFSHHTDIEGKFDSMPIKGKNAKLEYVQKDLEEAGYQQSIIWAVYRAETNLLYKELYKDFPVCRLDGSVPKSDRGNIVAKFKSGEYQHLVANPRVAGFGYNFQMATLQYWYSRNYRTELRIQGEDRNYRIGTIVSPIYKDLLYNIAVENELLTTLLEEQQVNDLFITKGFGNTFDLKGVKL